MPKRPSRVTSSSLRRAAGGEHGAGHSRLVPAEPLRNAGLEQLHHLTGRPGVDVRKDAFADLLSEGSPHRPSSNREEQTPAAGKREPPRRGRRALCSLSTAETFATSLTGAQFDASPVRTRNGHHALQASANASFCTRSLSVGYHAGYVNDRGHGRRLGLSAPRAFPSSALSGRRSCRAAMGRT